MFRALFAGLSAVVLVVVGGACTALTLNTTAWEEHRVATVAFDEALVAAEHARVGAVAARQLLQLSVDGAQTLTEHAATITALPADVVDSSSLAPFVDALAAAVPDPMLHAVESIDGTRPEAAVDLLEAADALRGWTEQTEVLRRSAADLRTALDAAVDALRAGIMTVATNVTSGTMAVMDAAPLAADGEREAVRIASSRVDAAVADTDTATISSAIAEWSTAVSVLRAAQVTAEEQLRAEEEAAAERVVRNPVSSGPFSFWIDRPALSTDGPRVDVCPNGESQVVYVPPPSGGWMYFSATVPFTAAVVADGANWLIRTSICL
jgi:hypothetical protein